MVESIIKSVLERGKNEKIPHKSKGLEKKHFYPCIKNYP